MIDHYVEIEHAHVGKPMFYAFGRNWQVSGFIGRITTRDIGKRVYLRGGVLQVENNGQRNYRLNFEQGLKDRLGGNGCLSANGAYLEGWYSIPNPSRKEPTACPCGMAFKDMQPDEAFCPKCDTDLTDPKNFE